jgi:hypothetical protein
VTPPAEMVDVVSDIVNKSTQAKSCDIDKFVMVHAPRR